MIEITKQQAISDLKEMFGVDSDINARGSFCNDGKFFIRKDDIMRIDVIARLNDYFKDKYIKEGQCRIESITLVYTVFHIEDRTSQLNG